MHNVLRLAVLISVLSSLVSAVPVPIPVTKSGLPRPRDAWRIDACALSPRGDLLALTLSAPRHGTRLEFHALPGGEALWALPFAAPAQVEWAKDGATVLISGSVAQDDEDAILRVHLGNRTVERLPDRGRLIAAGADGARYAWRRPRGDTWGLLARTADDAPILALRMDDHLMPIAGAWAPDGKRLAYIGLDVSTSGGQVPAHSAFLVRATGRDKSEAVLRRTAAPVRPAWVNATTVRLVRGKPRAVLDCDTQSGRVTAVLDALHCPLLLDGALRALSPDGTVLAMEIHSATQPRVLRLLALPGGTVLGEWPADLVTFGRDGTQFALRLTNQSIVVFDRGKQVATLSVAGD